MNKETICTTLKVSIHRKGTNPVFDENSVHVSVEDESGGPFIVIESEQCGDNGLRIGMEELEAATVAARKLFNEFESNVTGE